MCDRDVGQDELPGGYDGRGLLADGSTSAGLPHLPVPSVPGHTESRCPEIRGPGPEDDITVDDSDDWGECPPSPSADELKRAYNGGRSPSADELYRAYNGNRGSPFPLRAAPVPPSFTAQQAQGPPPSAVPTLQEAPSVSIGGRRIRCTDHGGVKKYAVVDVFEAAGVLGAGAAIYRFTKRKNVRASAAHMHSVQHLGGKTLYTSREGLSAFVQEFMKSARGRNKKIDFGHVIVAL